MSLLRFMLMSLILLSTTLWAGVGKVALLKGEATLERGVQKLALQNGTSLEEKDTIKTSKDAQVQLMFEDKTVITLGSESEFKIEEYLNDTANPKAKFKFNQGTFKTITGQIGKTAPDNFTLETKTATIGIRGTIVTGRTSANGDAIGCTSGLIAVRTLGSQNFILVPAGKITFVTPGKDPTPPRDMRPGEAEGTTGGSNSGGGENDQSAGSGDSDTQTNAQTQESTPSVTTTATKATSKANDDTLFEKVKTTADETNYNKIYKGFYSSLYSATSFEPYEVVFQYSLTDTISYTYADNLFTVTAPLDTFSRTVTMATNTYDEILTGTTFKKIDPVAIGDFTIKVNGSSLTISGAQQTIWYDYDYREIAISKISKGSFDNYMSPRYEEVVIAGSMSPTIPSSGLFFFDTVDGLFEGTTEHISGIAHSDYSERTAIVANLNNKKILSLWLSEDGVSIGMGKIFNNASFTLSEYATAYSLNTFAPAEFPTISYIGYAELDGSLYGSHYQALAFSGTATGISTDFDEVNYEYIQQNSLSASIALRNISESYTPTNSYANSQVLTGMMASQYLSDSAASFTNDLTITLNKGAGTVSVSSSDLTIASTESAYIHDDYFATLSTVTYENTKLMKDYLMAISFDSVSEDYVSWGYWGSHSIQTSTDPHLSTTTTPFSTWVAGIQTPTSVISSLISNATTYSYAGHVIGSVINDWGEIGYIKNNASNNAQFTFNFGSSSFAGNIAFQDSLDTTWNTAMSGSLTTNGFTSAINDSGTTGNLNGKFYGPAANSVAGTFNLVNTNADKAVGSFKAIKQITTP